MEIAIRKSDMAVFKDGVPENEEGSFTVITSLKSMIAQFSRQDALSLLESAQDVALTEEQQSFTLDQACKAALDLLKKNKKVTKVSLLKAAIKDGGTFSRKTLAESCGYDNTNVHVAMRILGDPKRTKEPIEYTYDQANKNYIVTKG